MLQVDDMELGVGRLHIWIIMIALYTLIPLALASHFHHDQHYCSISHPLNFIMSHHLPDEDKLIQEANKVISSLGQESVWFIGMDNITDSGETELIGTL